MYTIIRTDLITEKQLKELIKNGKAEQLLELGYIALNKKDERI